MLSSPQSARRMSAAAVLTMIALLGGTAIAATDKCGAGASALSDAKAIAGVRGVIARQCPCADFDGSTPQKKHGKFVACAKALITDATDGSPLLGTFTLRKECKTEVKNEQTACGSLDPNLLTAGDDNCVPSGGKYLFEGPIRVQCITGPTDAGGGG